TTEFDPFSANTLELVLPTLAVGSFIAVAAIVTTRPSATALAAYAVASLIDAAVVVVFLPIALVRATGRAPRAASDWPGRVADRYRHVGPVVGHYAAAKCRQDPLVEHLPELFEGRERVWVVGCGYGIMSTRIIESCPGVRLRAIDVDGRKVEVLRAVLRDVPRVEVEIGDVRDHPHGEETFDVALLVDVLHYWSAEQQESIVEAVVQRLAPGGRLILRDGCAKNDDLRGGEANGVARGERIARALGFTRDFGAFHFRSASGWGELLSRHGLRVERIEPEWGTHSNVVWVARRDS
ncbi:MAG: methyltransferase domain-containing protein, partial [Planctomycetes bacterium]|nr:methyltransferase domain-containing protein [Planctomycetota bacterium]